MADLPKDPMILLSVVNTKLRDFYADLDTLCQEMQIEKKELTEKLASIVMNMMQAEPVCIERLITYEKY